MTGWGAAPLMPVVDTRALDIYTGIKCWDNGYHVLIWSQNYTVCGETIALVHRDEAPGCGSPRERAGTRTWPS